MGNYFISPSALPSWHKKSLSTEQVDLSEILLNTSALAPETAASLAGKIGTPSDCFFDGETDFSDYYYSISNDDLATYSWIQTLPILSAQDNTVGIIAASAPYASGQNFGSKTLKPTGLLYILEWNSDTKETTIKDELNYSFETIPSPVVIIQLTGGGGGGAGGYRPWIGWGSGGGGGGGGAILRTIIDLSKIPNHSCTISIGYGGAAGAKEYKGDNGGDSYIEINSQKAIAHGGGGGKAGSSSGVGSGGSGGTAENNIATSGYWFLQSTSGGSGGSGSSGDKTGSSGSKCPGLAQYNVSPYAKLPSYGANGGAPSGKNAENNPNCGGGGGGSLGAGGYAMQGSQAGGGVAPTANSGGGGCGGVPAYGGMWGANGQVEIWWQKEQ